MKKAGAAAVILTMILIYPQASVDGARRAMALWYESVAPVLFPFFVFMPLLTSADACRVYERIFSKFTNRVFALPGAATPAIVISMLAGSPAGALAITRAASAGEVNATEAKRMAIALSGLSPSFLILGIGQELYGSAELGWKLAGAQVGIQTIMLICTRKMSWKEEKIPSVDAENLSGVKAAVENILVICGYMTVIGAVSSVIASILGSQLGNLLLLALDLPGGSAALSEMELKGKMVLQCGAIGFSGVCIALQNMDVLKRARIKWKHYLAGRCVSAGLFVGIGCILASNVHETIGTGELRMNMKLYAASVFFACATTVLWIGFDGICTFLNKRKL